jgi:hypothetical protein
LGNGLGVGSFGHVNTNGHHAANAVCSIVGSSGTGSGISILGLGSGLGSTQPQANDISLSGTMYGSNAFASIHNLQNPIRL